METKAFGKEPATSANPPVLQMEQHFIPPFLCFLFNR